MMEVKNTIIHEGGDSYRPVIIIPINNTDLWPNKNIAYFRSSGRTNKTPQYSNTWFPFGGIIEQNNTKILSEPVNKGHIIKMSDLLKKRDSNWKSNLCMEYFRRLENKTFQNQTFEKIVNTLTPQSTNIDAVELLFIEAYLIKKFLDDYFFFDWQLRISAQIGGGFWDRNPIFCTFVLGLNSIPVINIPLIPDYFAKVEGELAEYVQGDVEGNNTDYVINFVKQNESQLELPDGLTALQTLENNNIPEIDPATKKDYENAILRAPARIQEMKRTLALLARMKLGSKKTELKPVKLEPVHQNNIEQLNTIKTDDAIVPQNKKAKIESIESKLRTTINTNEPTTRPTRSTKIPQQPDTNKRKRGGKTIKRKGKTIKRKGKGTKKRRNPNKRK